ASHRRSGDLKSRPWPNAALCHAGCVLLSTEPARAATFAAMEHTHQVESIVSFDVNVRSSLWAFPAHIRNTITMGAEQADILKLSADEIEFIGEQSSLSAGPLDKSWLTTVGVA